MIAASILQSPVSPESGSRGPVGGRRAGDGGVGRADESDSGS